VVPAPAARAAEIGGPKTGPHPTPSVRALFPTGMCCSLRGRRRRWVVPAPAARAVGSPPVLPSPLPRTRTPPADRRGHMQFFAQAVSGTIASKMPIRTFRFVRPATPVRSRFSKLFDRRCVSIGTFERVRAPGWFGGLKVHDCTVHLGVFRTSATRMLLWPNGPEL
jgi:hypothetical protein